MGRVHDGECKPTVTPQVVNAQIKSFTSLSCGGSLCSIDKTTCHRRQKGGGGGGGGVGGGKTPIFLRHFDFFGLPRKVRTNHPSYPPRNGSETPCDPKIHAKGDSEYEKMQKNSEKVAF